MIVTSAKEELDFPIYCVAEMFFSLFLFVCFVYIFLFKIYVSYRVFNCILVHFIPLYLTLSFTSFYSFTGIYILFLYRYLYFTHSFSLFYFIYSFFHVHVYTVRAYFTHSFSLFYSIFVYSFSLLYTVPAWVGLYRVVSLCVRVCLCADVLSLSCVCQSVTILDG